MNGVPAWRLVAAVGVLAGLVFFSVLFAPIYAHNLQLRSFLSDVVADPASAAKSDDLLRTWVVDRAHQLDLPVKADNVQIYRSAEGLAIAVRYYVRVTVPGYTVDLHFNPDAGSR